MLRARKHQRRAVEILLLYSKVRSVRVCIGDREALKHPKTACVEFTCLEPWFVVSKEQTAAQKKHAESERVRRTEGLRHAAPRSKPLVFAELSIHSAASVPKDLIMYVATPRDGTAPSEVRIRCGCVPSKAATVCVKRFLEALLARSFELQRHLLQDQHLRTSIGFRV